MGIEVVGFSSASHVAKRHSDRRCELDEHYVVGPECKLLDGCKPGCYESGSAFTFSVSYGAFDTWQEALSQVVLGVPATEVGEDESRFVGQPFVELIALPCGNDIGIGPVTSAKLHRDFVMNSTRVRSGFQCLTAQAEKRIKKHKKRPTRMKNRPAILAESLVEALGGTVVGGDAHPDSSRWEWKWKLYRDFRKAFSFGSDDGMVILSI